MQTAFEGSAGTPSKPDMASDFTKNMRVIGALVMREVSTRFGRTPGGFLWAILQPLGVIVLLGFAFSLISRSPALGTSFIFFKATGMLVFQVFLTNSRLVGQSINFSRPLLAYPGVTWIHAIIARSLLNTYVMFLVSVLILSGIKFVEGIQLIIDWGPIFMAMMIAAVMGASVGMLNAFLFERFKIWENIWRMITAPLMLTSGVIILYENLPIFAREILWYNPIMHLTGFMREGFYSTYEPQYVSLIFVLNCTLIPMFFGLILLRRYNRQLQDQ